MILTVPHTVRLLIRQPFFKWLGGSAFLGKQRLPRLETAAEIPIGWYVSVC